MGLHQLSTDLPEALKETPPMRPPGTPQLPLHPAVGGSSPLARAAPLLPGPLLRKRASRGATSATESSLVPSFIREPEPTPPGWLVAALGRADPEPSMSAGGAAAPGHVHPTPAAGSHP